MRSALRLLAPVLGLAVFFGAWELLVVVYDVQPFAMPKPSSILSDMAGNPGFFARNAWVTAREALTGMAVGAIGGVLVAIPMAHVDLVDRAVQPVATFIQVTPLIGYAPAVVLLIGPGFGTIVVIASLVCFAPFLFGAVTGMRSLDPATLELMRSVDAPWWEVLWRLRLPHAVPYLFAAGRTAVGLALIGAALGEWFALVNEGLGWAIKQGSNFNSAPQVWGATISLAIVGLIGLGLLRGAERLSGFGPAPRAE